MKSWELEARSWKEEKNTKKRHEEARNPEGMKRLQKKGNYGEKTESAESDKTKPAFAGR
ncbi:MAG: hypothetical protein R6U62_00975 [Bacteroidales bacterium]